MRIWLRFLTGIGSLLIGILLGRRLPLRHQISASSHKGPSRPALANDRLTLDQLLDKIEKNGGPEGLDLSGQDLSWLDLSSEAIEAVLLRNGFTRDVTPPVWVSPYTWGKMLVGLNLRGANLEGTNLQRVNLRGANLSRAIIRDADLRDAGLQAADIHDADCRCARFWRADFREILATDADFTGASLYRANFENGRLLGARFHNASLEYASLAGARVTRNSIGAHIIQERPERYAEFLHWDDPTLSEQEWDLFYIHRLERARNIYLELVNSFSQHGYRDDASWAYLKERQLERQMHDPLQARRYFGDEVSQNGKGRTWHWLWFYVRHFVRWLLLWASELSCGYGERPLRTIGWALVIVFIFPYLYWQSGGIANSTGIGLTWLDYLNYSFGAFATVGFTRLITTNALAEALTSAEALLGIATLALLMFTLGNRISRR